MQEEVRAITKGCHGVRGFIRKSGANHRRSLGQGQGGEGEEEEGEGTSDAASVTSSMVGVGKQWKRHNNQNKKEKTWRTVHIS